MDKSGEYYLKNIQLQNKKKDNVRKSLNIPQNLENCLNKKDFNKIKRKASKIVTLLPENSLTPIPKKKDVKDNFFGSNLDKKELNDAQRTAVFIRRLEYSTSMKRQAIEDKNAKIQAKKIGLIQEWWKAMFKIIKIQKNFRGFSFRKKLMNNLEHQEKLLQFITEFDNIHSYHLYKQFMDNLKKKSDYEKNKLMEKCEDFNDKMDNLEKMHNYENFKKCFQKWKDNTKKERKLALENLCNKLKDFLINKEKEEKKLFLDKIKLKEKEEENKLNNKIKNFQEIQARKKFFNNLKKLYKENQLKKEKEKEKNNKLEISSNVNYLDIIDKKNNLENNDISKKENQIFISPQNEINILKEPHKKIILSQDYQSFSLISPDNIKFNFGEPSKKLKKLDNNASIQIDKFITSIRNKEEEKKILEILDDIFEQAKHVIEKERKKNILEQIKEEKKILDILDEIFEEAKHVIDKVPKKNILEEIKEEKRILEILDDIFEQAKHVIEKQPKEKENNENDNKSDIKEDTVIIKPVHLLQKITINDKKEQNKVQVYFIERKSLLFSMKKEIKNENDKNDKNISFVKKRISNRRSPKKSGYKNKRFLKNALDKWKSNSKLIKDLELFDKYRKKVLHDLLKEYQKCHNDLLKKYFDKWKTTENEDEQIEKEENLKYKKKPKFEFKNDILNDEYEQETLKDKDRFQPSYALPKENLYFKQFENNNNEEEEYIQEPIDSNDIDNIYNDIKEKIIPYKKKYGIRNYYPKDNTNINNNYITEEINPDDQIEQLSKIQNKKIKKKYLKNFKNKEHTGDTSSDESYLSGMTLILNNKEIKEPRNYVSQSFFINKKNEKIKSPYRNNDNSNNNDIYKINDIPNMMKGDFWYFIENNPKIFNKKNPRIQVTRSTCDLTNIINNGNINININSNSDDDFLNKIIQNCDYDLYANQKSKSKKDKWYSMSIPFNQLKQSFDYNRFNNKNSMMDRNININEINVNKNNNYTLQEMNCSQFYKSPMRSFKKNKYEDNFKLKDPLIRIPGKHKRNINKSLSPFHINYRASDNDDIN